MPDITYISNIDELRIRYALLSHEERDLFMDMTMDWRRSQSFSQEEAKEIISARFRLPRDTRKNFVD